MNGIYNITDFGAVGDGRVKNTRMIQAAIDHCAAQGGGIVSFTPGIYLSGTLYLRSHICLDIAPGAVLLGSHDPEDYNADDFCPQNRVCESEYVSGAHLLVALEVTGLTLRGGGRIDGNRKAFMNKSWDEFPTVFEWPPGWRPAQILFFCECSDVTIENLELCHAPYWTCLLHGCENVVLNNLKIWNDQRTHNGDGIDIDCCRKVMVSNCNIDSGDDCITLRANFEPLQNGFNACELVTVTNCILRTTRCNAIRIGVGGGIIRNCVFSNIVVHDSRTGICIISQYLDAMQAEITNIMFSNMLLDTKRIFVISSNIQGPRDEPSKEISGISFSHIRARSCHTALIQGNADCKIEDITFSNVRLEYYGGSDIPADKSEFAKVTGETSPVKTSNSAVWLKNCRNLYFHNTQVIWSHETDGPWRKALETQHTESIIMEQCSFDDFPQP